MDNGSLPPNKQNDQPGVPPAPAPEPGGYVPIWPEGGSYSVLMSDAGGDALPAPKKKKTRVALIIAAIVIVLGAAAAAIVLWVLPGQKAEPLPDLNNPLPLLYEKGGEVYLGSGENTVCLGDAKLILHNEKVGLSAMCSFNNSQMIYLADTDEQTGLGTLMMVQTDGLSQPQQIADNVYAAQLSSDGTKVLYVKASSGGNPLAGDLYLYIPEAEPKLISDAVYAEQFGFSPKGGSFYFVTTIGGSNNKKFSLYTRNGEAENHLVQQISNNYLSPFYDICVGEDGTVVFRQWNYDTDHSDLYLAQDSKAEMVAEDALIVKTFGSPDNLLYSSGTKLYYMAPGEKGKLITDIYADVAFPNYQGSDPDYISDRHFIFAESDEDDPDVVTLYEQNIGEDPVKITKADNTDFLVHTDFTWVACFKNGELCLYQKTEDGWNQAAVLGDNIISCGFDYIRRQNFYYIQGRSEDAESGDVCFYSLEDSTTTTLLHDATEIVMYGEEIFALQDIGTLYRLSDGEFERFAEDITGTQQTAGGLYAFSGEDKLQITFYADSDTEPMMVEQNVERCLPPTQAVIFSTPLQDNEKHVLNDLHHDAMVTLDLILNSNTNAEAPNHPANDDSVFALLGYASYNVTDDIRRIFYWYHIGFSYLAKVEGGDAQSQENYENGVKYLKYAEELYAEYTSLNN